MADPACARLQVVNQLVIHDLCSYLRLKWPRKDHPAADQQRAKCEVDIGLYPIPQAEHLRLSKNIHVLARPDPFADHSHDQPDGGQKPVTM
jgi:hypothetical protein